MNYSIHELLDRTNMVVEIVEAHLLAHPLLSEPETQGLQQIQSKIEKAQSLLSSAYQDIGNLPEAFTK